MANLTSTKSGFYTMLDPMFANMIDLDEYYGAPIPKKFRACIYCGASAIGINCGKIAELGTINWAPEDREFIDWLGEELGLATGINIAVPICGIHNDTEQDTQ